VRADGEAGGYRWGAARKRHLLETEKGIPPSRLPTTPASP
jgi:hypothetical protein